MRARRRFGQHFLHDPGVLDKIVTAIRPKPGDHIVEIGPGRGALTHALLEGWPEGATLDPSKSIATWRRGCAMSSRATLTSPFTRPTRSTSTSPALAAERGGRLRIVGNLPYNISTPLLFHLLGSASAIDDLHIMLQREVVDRIAAQPGTGDYGRLTVMLTPWVVAESLFDVGPGAFKPPPKVWSAVARLGVRREPAFPVSPHFGAVVAAAFSHRRKTIRNALRGVVTPEQITACDVDLGARPETISPASFNRLARTLD